MHIYTCTNERTKNARKNIFQLDTQKKKNTTTRDNTLTILIGLLRFGKTTTTLYSFFK